MDVFKKTIGYHVKWYVSGILNSYLILFHPSSYYFSIPLFFSSHLSYFHSLLLYNMILCSLLYNYYSFFFSLPICPPQLYHRKILLHLHCCHWVTSHSLYFGTRFVFYIILWSSFIFVISFYHNHHQSHVVSSIRYAFTVISIFHCFIPSLLLIFYFSFLKF